MFQFKKAKPEAPQPLFFGAYQGDREASTERSAEMRKAILTEEKRFWRFDLRKVNFRAVSILLGVGLLVLLIYFPVTYLQGNYLRRSALEQARRFVEHGQAGQALGIMEQYLDTWPNDLAGLQYEGELLAKYASDYQEVTQGTKIIENLLRLDADSPSRQADRKRLVELMIKQGDIVQAGAISIPGLAKQESLYKAANLVAEQRIKLGADDAEAHRLVAITLERLAHSGDTQSMPLAIKEYQKALRRDPGDYQSADRLASLRLETRKDQAGADQILDDLVKARPRLLEARLVRARHFLRTNRDDRSKVELEAATRLAPGDSGVRMMAASLAIRRNDAVAARRHLDAIPEKDRENPKVALLSGQIELTAYHTEKAIDEWRRGLILSAGTDHTLTWRLAFTLIRLGRSAEARPLIEQYRRLVTRTDHPMLVLLEGFQKERSGKHAAAIADLNPIREEIDPEWKPEIELTLGRCYQVTGNSKEARASFVRARNLQPTWPLPRIALARLIFATTRNLALEELEEGIRLCRGANEAPFHAARVQLYTAEQLGLPESQRNWTAVEAALERGRKVNPDDPELAQAASEYLFAVKRTDDALAILQEATRGNGRFREDSWLALANLLAKVGRKSEATSVLLDAANPKNAGDLARFRIVRSGLLLKSGQGRAAIEALTRGAERLPAVERAKLAQAKTDLLFDLGDLSGGRAACLEWANLAPDETGPGLKLLALAAKGGSVEDSELGIELLRKAGGEDEPNTLAVRAMSLLESSLNPDASTDSGKLDEAELLVQRLKEVAPDLPVSSLAQAMFLEASRSYEEAISEYKVALTKDPKSKAMSRLVELLTRLKRPDDIAKLKLETNAGDVIDRLAVGAAAESGDEEQAGAILEDLVKAQPDSLEYRALLARMFVKMGKPQQASETLKALIDRQPDRPQPWLALLSTQLSQKDRPAALSTIDRLKKTYKGRRLDLLVARCYWELGDIKGAGQLLDESMAKNPADLETIRAACLLSEVSGATERTEALLRKALKIDPNASWACQKLAILLVNRPGPSRWAEAWALVSTPSSGQADTPESRLNRWIVLEKAPELARRAEARDGLQTLVDDLPSTNPVAFQARIRLTRMLLGSNDPAAAARAIAPISADPAVNEPTVLALAIEAMTRSGRIEEARQRLERLAKVEPNTPLTIGCRAMVLKTEGDLEGAASTIEEAATVSEKANDGDRQNLIFLDQLIQLKLDEAADRLGRKIAGRWAKLAWAWAGFLADRGRFDEALDAARIAADAGSNLEAIRLIVAMSSAGRLNPSQIDRGRTLVVSITMKEPKNSEFISLTAWLLRQQGRYEDEAALYRAVLAVDPANLQARNNLAWVLSDNLNRPVEGLAEVDRVIKQSGLSPQNGDTRGVILMKLGRFDEAIIELERATKSSPNAIHYLHLSRAMAAKGRAEEARTLLNEAKKVLKNPKELEPADYAELVASAGR